MMLADVVVQTLHGNIGVGLVGCGAAIGIGLAGFGAALATGRNPGAFGKIFTTAILAMALSKACMVGRVRVKWSKVRPPF